MHLYSNYSREVLLQPENLLGRNRPYEPSKDLRKLSGATQRHYELRNSKAKRRVSVATTEESRFKGVYSVSISNLVFRKPSNSRS